MGSRGHRTRTTEVGRAALSTKAAPTQVWERWIDHTTWPAWVADCREVVVSAPLRCSSRGRRRLSTGSVEDFVVTTFVPGRTYAETVRLIGARLESRREVVCQHDGSEVSVAVSIHGRLAWLYRRRLARRLSTSLPAELSRLVALAERRSAVGAGAPPLVSVEDVADVSVGDEGGPSHVRSPRA